MHGAHSPQGSSLKFSQLIALAKIFATVVLPVPLGPAKRYAWAILPVLIAFFKVDTNNRIHFLFWRCLI